MRFFDYLLAAVGLVIFSPVIAVITILGFFDTGSPFFKQTRVGRHQKPFSLVKFRTMKVGTASVASHLANHGDVTPLGRFLRRSKLDELPQLWNVLKGDMSLVGPRPCLYNQEELIAEREQRAVFDALPGITGLGQVQGVDMSRPLELAEVDQLMLQTLTLKAYFMYLLRTLIGKGTGDQVKKSGD